MDDYLNNDMFNNLNYDDLLYGDNGESAVYDSLRDSASIGVATKAGQKMNALQSAMDNYAKSLNESAIAKSTGLPVKTPSAQYKGFAAEEFFKQRLKINALAEGVPDYKIGVYTKGLMPDGSELSPIDMEVDISIWTRKHFWSKPERVSDYQSKMFDNASDYSKAINNPQYKDVNFVGGSGQEVNDVINVNVDGKTISSDSITPADARQLADHMKAQTTPAYEQRAEKIDRLNTKNLGDAVKGGAVIGFTVSTIREIIDVIKNGNELTEEQFVESIKNIMCGTAEGAIRGGAINLSVQLLGDMLGEEITSTSFEAVPAMAIANFSVDLAKDLYKCFVKETIDTDDLLCNSFDNLFASFAGFAGGWIGGQIAGWLVSTKASAETGAAIGSSVGPIGTIIGTVIGGVIFGFGARIISNTAGKDAYSAYKTCVDDINSHVKVAGIEKLYYFADSMSSLSEHKLSFKDLLPCYNLISDLKEYNYHKKALNSLSKQLQSNIDELDNKKKKALLDLENEHKQKLRLLTDSFEDQRQLIRDEFKESLNSYVVTSYMQYANACEMHINSIRDLMQEYDEQKEIQSNILQYMKNRNKVNQELNSMLTELMSDEESKQLLGPFIEKLLWFMHQDELMIGKQFISFDDTISLINGGALT